jgi:predicted amidophosphoribosyltransferase
MLVWLDSLIEKAKMKIFKIKREDVEDYPLTGLMVAAKYEEPLPTIIHEMKYNSLKGLLEPLGKILIEALREIKPRGKFLIVPVPLYFLRKKSRGFNQSEELAKIVAKEFGWEIKEKFN